MLSLCKSASGAVRDGVTAGGPEEDGNMSDASRVYPTLPSTCRRGAREGGSSPSLCASGVFVFIWSSTDANCDDHRRRLAQQTVNSCSPATCEKSFLVNTFADIYLLFGFGLLTQYTFEKKKDVRRQADQNPQKSRPGAGEKNARPPGRDDVNTSAKCNRTAVAQEQFGVR
ncbi:hypothetical protein F2P81_022647 [Scophthalmus maximus]|uniref:Uncharacterized protein n=1 Tax=Scophthalmus maximus TaxID=52904 RepID=A0A6A4RSW9_SCOMX|nr:hypothetical protein F2P81_022647 [Scophthalmus maximus]